MRAAPTARGLPLAGPVSTLAWPASALLLAAATLVVAFMPTLGTPAAASFEWQPTAWAAEPWRAWTAAFVHLSPAHLAGNLLAALLVGAFGHAARVPPRTALAWFAAWPLTHVALLLWPTLRHYGGLSGVLHAGVAAAAVHLCLARDGRERWIGLLSLSVLVAKVLAEAPWRGPVQRVPAWDIPIAPVAHATGLAAGAACSAMAEAAQRFRRRLAEGSARPRESA